MSGFDKERLALEAASGGKNTLILDDLGLPSVMVRIPKCRWSDIVDGGPDTTCSAFIVDGVEYDEIFISKYHNIVEGGRAYSLPGRDPGAYMTLDQAKQYCEAKGSGWHLLTNVEYMLLAHWCRANGTIPHGNNWCGRDVDHKWEHGVPSYDWILNYNWNGMANSNDGTNYHHTGRTLTGSGPASWFHDATTFGVDDLNGNVWDWVGGLRLQNGEIQIIPDNNAAKHVDQSATSSLWKAILQDGSLVAPGTTDTLKINSDTVGNNSQTQTRIGAPILDVVNDKPAYTGGVVDVDWPKVATSGVKGVILRAGYGNDIGQADRLFTANIKGAIAAGLKVAVYWFSYADSIADAKKEWAVCRQVISPYQGKILFVAADYEYDSYNYYRKQHGTAPSKTLINNMVNAFLGAAKADGWGTCLYTNNDYRLHIFSAATMEAWPVWLADYSGGPDIPCAMQQTGSTGTVPGISGHVDLDICFKDFSIAVDYTCDTSGIVKIQRGKAYQAKITCKDAPKIVAGTSDIMTVLHRYDDGDNHYFWFVPIGKSGEQAGIYINGGPRQFVAEVA